MAVHLVQALGRFGHASAFFVQMRAVETCNGIHQVGFLVRAKKDGLEVNSGKSLPFLLKSGNHLPQTVFEIRHFLVRRMMPAAIIASAIFAGRIG